MGKNEIIGELARQRVVEGIVQSITHRPLDGDILDLVQMVYLILLEYDEDKIIDLDEHGEIRYFIVRVVLNQYRSETSPFYRTFRRQYARNERIGRRDFADGKE